MKNLEPYARSAMRIVLGFTIMCHGLQKLFGMFGGMGPDHARALFPSVPWWAAVFEMLGAFLILGLFTRCVAFLLSGEMAVAYFMVHQPRAILPIQNGGELAVVYCFAFLYLSTAGGGPLSLDATLRKTS